MSKTYKNAINVLAGTIAKTGGGGKRQKSLGLLPGDRPRYLRPAEAAEYLSVGTSTLYRLIARKEIKVSCIAGVRLLRSVDLDALVEANLQ